MFMTDFTLVWSFSSMSQHVSLQMSGVVEPFVANLTPVWLTANVDLRVSLQRIGSGE